MILFYHLPRFCAMGDESFFIVMRNIFDFFMACFFYKSGMFYQN